MADEDLDTPADFDQSGAGPGPDGGHEAEEALESVRQAVESVQADVDGSPVDLPEFGADLNGRADGAAISLLDDVALNVKIELGRTRMFVEDVLRLDTDSVIELDKAAGDPVDIYVNNRHIARGEVLVLNESFCVRISEILDAGHEEETAKTDPT